MTIKDVTYCTTTCLNCPAAPADVYLCLQGVEVAQELCTAQTEIEDTYTRSTIPATLVDAVKSGCGYKYTFHYDTENLVGNTVLKSNNIAGVLCNGCIISVIEDTFGDEPFIDVDIETGAYYFVSNHGCRYELPTTVAGITVEDTDSIDLTLAGTVLSGVVIISPDADNQIEERANGLYVPISSGGITVTDTASVNLTLTGSDLEADVVISADVGNQLEERIDGLYVPDASGLLLEFTRYTPTITFSSGSLTFDHTNAYFAPAGEGLFLNLNFQTGVGAAGSMYVSLPPGYVIAADADPNTYYSQMIPAILHSPGGICVWAPMVGVTYAGNTTIELFMQDCTNIPGGTQNIMVNTWLRVVAP